jgi:hypothetical protein
MVIANLLFAAARPPPGEKKAAGAYWRACGLSLKKTSLEAPVTR